MGEEIKPITLYAIEKETGESFEIGKQVEPVDLVEEWTIEDDKQLIDLDTSMEVKFHIKKIKKKRFIKLLMAKSYQRNEAMKIHEEYMKEGYLRNRLGLELFVKIMEEQKANMYTGNN